jgi:hypothetical protein
VALVRCIPDPLEVKNIPGIKTEIVVNTQIIPDGSIMVFLSKTIGAIDVSDNDDPVEVLNYIAVNDATVTIDGPNESYPLLFLGAGFYGGVNIDFVSGETYALIVNSESLGTVTATTTAMKQVLFESIEVDRYFNGFDYTLAQVTYTIQDPVEKNNYMISVQRISLDDPPLYERVLNPRTYTRLVNDEDFEGEIAEEFRAAWQDYEAGDTAMVSLANVSKEYYDFIKLRLDNRVGFVEFVSEPLNYPSNVIGGRGYFNLYIPDIRFFILE